MKPRSDELDKVFAVFLVTMTIACVVSCGWWGVIESSEARYTEISREMFESKDFIHPTLLSIQHYHKPPLTYWITSVAFYLFGVNEFAVRFFLQLSLLLQIILVYRLTALLFDRRTALVAAIIYSSFPLVLVASRGLTTDSYLATFVLASVYSWFRWKKQLQPRWLYASCLSLALGFLTKGPVVLVVPMLVMLGFNKVAGKVSGQRLHITLAVLVSIVFSLSWFLYLMWTDKIFVEYFLVRHTVERFAAADVFTRKQPWWYFLAFAPVVAAPWIVTTLIKFDSWKQGITGKFWIWWILFPLVFFSLSSSKLILYVLPLYPGLAIICALHFTTSENRAKQTSRFLTWFMFMIALSMVAGFFLGPGEIYDPVAAIASCLFLVIVVLLYAKKIDHFTRAISLTMVWSLFLIAVSTIFLARHELKTNSTRPISKWMREHSLGVRPVAVYNQLLPSMAFNLRHNVLSINDGNRYLLRETQFESNTQWRSTLLDLRKTEDARRLDSMTNTPAVIIQKGNSTKADSIFSKFRKRVTFDKWVLFYN